MPQETSDSYRDVDPAPLSSAIGEFWSLGQTATRLDLPDQELLKLARSNSVLHVVTADDQWLFPAFQFRNQRVIPALVPILQTVLAATDGWEVTQWLMTPAGQLGNKTPLETTRAGDAKSLGRLQRLAEQRAKVWQRT